MGGKKSEYELLSQTHEGFLPPGEKRTLRFEDVKCPYCTYKSNLQVEMPVVGVVQAAYHPQELKLRHGNHQLEGTITLQGTLRIITGVEKDKIYGDEHEKWDEYNPSI